MIKNKEIEFILIWVDGEVQKTWCRRRGRGYPQEGKRLSTGGEEAIHRRGRGYLQEAKAKVRLDVKLDRLLG